MTKYLDNETCRDIIEEYACDKDGARMAYDEVARTARFHDLLVPEWVDNMAFWDMVAIYENCGDWPEEAFDE